VYSIIWCENKNKKVYNFTFTLTKIVVLFTQIKKKCINERKRKVVLSVFVKYWWILLYRKCKIEYIVLRVIKVVLIRVIIEKNN